MNLYFCINTIRFLGLRNLFFKGKKKMKLRKFLFIMIILQNLFFNCCTLMEEKEDENDDAAQNTMSFKVDGVQYSGGEITVHSSENNDGHIYYWFEYKNLEKDNKFELTINIKAKEAGIDPLEIKKYNMTTSLQHISYDGYGLYLSEVDEYTWCDRSVANAELTITSVDPTIEGTFSGYVCSSSTNKLISEGQFSFPRRKTI